MTLRATVKNLRRTLQKPVGDLALRRAVRQGLPGELIPPLRFLADETRSRHAEEAARQVEAVRKALADRGGEVDVMYSPKPESAGEDTSSEARPEPGQMLTFTHHRIATQTSVPPRWGGFLHLCAEASAAEYIVELGSCAGIAACYLASAPQGPRVVTVEGSAGLAAIARENTSQVSDRVQVVNALFDDALDDLLAEAPSIGLAWIDGHHEQVATIHYFRRLIPALSPGAWVLFDDVSWSQDMREAWKQLAGWEGFSHTVDLGKLGVGIWAGGDVMPRRWDLRSVGGVKRIGTPKGWSE